MGRSPLCSSSCEPHRKHARKLYKGMLHHHLYGISTLFTTINMFDGQSFVANPHNPSKWWGYLHFFTHFNTIGRHATNGGAYGIHTISASSHYPKSKGRFNVDDAKFIKWASLISNFPGCMTFSHRVQPFFGSSSWFCSSRRGISHLTMECNLHNGNTTYDITSSHKLP